MKKLLICILTIILTMTGCSAKVSTIFGNNNQLTLTGDIQNNIISANSIIAGRIIEMNKQQGEPVKKGEIIAVIDHTNQKFAVDQLQAVVDMKKAKLEELQAGTRPQQIEQASAQVRAAKAKLDLLTSGTRKEQIAQAKNSVSIAEEALKSIQFTYDHVETQYNKTLSLYNEGALSQNELDQAKLTLDTTAKQLASTSYQLETAKQQLAMLVNGATPDEINAAKANYDAAAAQLKLLQSGATKQTIDVAIADLDQAIAHLNQAKNNLENSHIVALADGIIISKNVELGDVVNVGSNIADIAIADDVYVLCYIPNEYLDKIAYNQELTVETSLGEQTGKVTYIDLHHEYTPKDKQSTTDGKRIATKMKVAIDDQNGKLKNGMTADVIISLK